jgi:hypothetical protein
VVFSIKSPYPQLFVLPEYLPPSPNPFPGREKIGRMGFQNKIIPIAFELIN